MEAFVLNVDDGTGGKGFKILSADEYDIVANRKPLERMVSSCS